MKLTKPQYSFGDKTPNSIRERTMKMKINNIGLGGDRNNTKDLIAYWGIYSNDKRVRELCEELIDYTPKLVDPDSFLRANR